MVRGIHQRKSREAGFRAVEYAESRALLAVACLVGFNGTPAALPADGGTRVSLRSGPLAGLKAVLVRRKNGARFVVSVDLIQRSVSLEIDEAALATTQ